MMLRVSSVLDDEVVAAIGDAVSATLIEQVDLA